ncbi:hypothetical protein ABB37_02969 [Leptomonas pyrrhocoris]|uniref:Uncharacterized protein n=1 Tax=Leptomonas pyrrhocoris TaxID=157538 RepID=A0A0M9G6J6_LEPPY|nr:hypothetical protein ABB37_02969 [Leptomonas pyrrhocoris]KPA83306.1 hypothetical protein ABB37_02969 [Leptomonas pyrrhocoris]|eukprot:XP_015661745.1 hypothetical protein ABB37_02969 [Leptomonas pyrrhocoris]
MLKSSLKAPSSIDHDLFPLLTVRSCVSEADESKNGPRFCAEDKMTGAAYEVRSRKLELVREPVDDAAEEKQREQPHEGQLLSLSNLQRIRRQQARIDALLSAVAQAAATPSVALPIDIYIQEQPTTGDTYVASVEAFAGLSLGDIIRSGWGVMEEQVFLEILSAVESFGYASAGLPPHGNLSVDAIKQLLIVRDGASEARQPSRWVVSDWLLLSDDDNLRGGTFGVSDVESFIADLEWMLHSSFAQLRISTAADGAYLAAAQVEDVINETVERIRSSLMLPASQSAAAAAAAPATTSVGEDGPSTCNAESEDETQKADEATPDLATTKGETHDAKFAPSLTAPAAHPETLTSPMETLPAKTSASGSELHNGVRLTRISARQLHGVDSNSNGVTAVKDTTRNMTLKDKMAYHQAALRDEQMLVNRHRRKNAPLPPRPTPAVHSGRKAATAFSPRSPADEDDVYYDAPSMGMPIHVKPSAYLMQGRRSSTSGNSKSGSSSARKLHSPSSACSPNNASRTPRDGSHSTTNGMSQPQQESKQSQPHQKHPGTPRKQAAALRDQRERLLDDVVNMVVLNQSRRGQCFKVQQEEDRKRRAQRQRVLAQSALSQTTAAGAVQQRMMPAVLERPRVSVTATSSNITAGVLPATTYEPLHSATDRRSSTVLTCSKNMSVSSTSAGPSAAEAVAGANPLGTFLLPAGGWSAHMSESPEPVPPSPCKRRGVHNCVAPPVDAATPHYPKPFGMPRALAGATATTAAAAPQVRQERFGGRGGRTTAVAPLTRPLRPTVGQKLRTSVNVTGNGGVREAPTGPQTKQGVPLQYSARGAHAAASHQTVSRVVSRPGGVAAGEHPLSARGKNRLLTAPPAEVPSKNEAPASPPLPPPQQHLAPASHNQPTPYVKPLPLSALGLRQPSMPGSPHAPTAGGSPRTANNSTSDVHLQNPHGADASLSNPLNAQKSSNGSSNPLPPTPPHFVAAATTTTSGVVQRGSGRDAQRTPNTARPLPPPPAMSPRGYRRVSSTGVVQSRQTGNTNLCSGTRVATPRFHNTVPSPAPLSGRRSAAGGGDATPATTMVHTPHPLLNRTPISLEDDKAFAAVNRKPMRRLVPVKVHANHGVTDRAQQTPWVSPRPGSATLQSRSANVIKAPGGDKQTTSSNAARRRSALRLGNVRPVNEASPGILLRHNRRPTA